MHIVKDLGYFIVFFFLYCNFYIIVTFKFVLYSVVLMIKSKSFRCWFTKHFKEGTTEKGLESGDGIIPEPEL